jgi:hypothetical protein
MKEIEELTERMNGVDEIMDSLIKKITDLEKKEIKVTDYSLHFEALQKIFEVFLVRYNKECNELNTAFGKLNIEYPAEQIQQNLSEIKIILTAIQKSLPVKVKHQFDFNTKGWIIAGMMLLIVTAVSTGLCGYLWVENSHLQTVNIKYNLLKQIDIISIKWVDSLYHNDPDKVIQTLNKLENGQLKFTEAGKIKKTITSIRYIKRHSKS